jgi:cytidylate kinase
MKSARRPSRGLVIAIDGPAGVGKSTIGLLIAKSLGVPFVNSGEMYRALTWKALEEGLDISNHEAVVALAQRILWEFKPAEGSVALRTFIDGQGVSTQIRAEKVGSNSSAVAAIPGVRKILCRLQRRLGRKGGIVMEGRDISTNVFPDADFKVYLDASVEERARRRFRQLKAAGVEADYQKIKTAILARDLNDIKRKINPLQQAEDALFVDSTHLTMHQVARRILRSIREKAK